MSDTSDTSNSSVVFVAEQKRIHVEVQPQPPTPAPSNTSAEETTSANSVPDTQGVQNSQNDIFVIPETGK